MKLFRTPVTLPVSTTKIGYADCILTLGSCFSEHMGSRLQRAAFDVLSNPLGVLYNPSSISSTLRRLHENRAFKKDEFFQTGSIWNHFDSSNLLSGSDLKLTLTQLNSRVEEGHNILRKADVLMLTFGTSWVYESDGRVVANCHKLPAAQFSRRRLTVEEIVEDYRDLFNQIKSNSLQVVLTVSPIRHWKDGAHENTLSKSILHLAVDQLCREFEFVHYFPAYEIVLDELRDYRFFASDMLHPSDDAIQYIWEAFVNTFIAEEDQQLMTRINQFRSQQEHRSLHPDTPEDLLFRSRLETQRTELIGLHPFLQNRI